MADTVTGEEVPLAEVPLRVISATIAELQHTIKKLSERLERYEQDEAGRAQRHASAERRASAILHVPVSSAFKDQIADDMVRLLIQRSVDAFPDHVVGAVLRRVKRKAWLHFRALASSMLRLLHAPPPPCFFLDPAQHAE